jgi:hypothetical protein
MWAATPGSTKQMAARAKRLELFTANYADRVSV